MTYQETWDYHLAKAYIFGYTTGYVYKQFFQSIGEDESITRLRELKIKRAFHTYNFRNDMYRISFKIPVRIALAKHCPDHVSKFMVLALAKGDDEKIHANISRIKWKIERIGNKGQKERNNSATRCKARDKRARLSMNGRPVNENGQCEVPVGMREFSKEYDWSTTK